MLIRMEVGRVVAGILVVFLAAGVPACAGGADEIAPEKSEFVSIRIFHTNDIHGHILPEPDYKSNLKPPPLLGGAASLATAMDLWRTLPAFGYAPDVTLYLDAGDFFQGTPEGTIPRGESMIDLYHRLRLDVMAAGNHDFDLGQAQLAKLVSLAKFPILSANTLDARTGRIAFGLKPRVILERGRIRFGIFGVITDDMPSISARSGIEGLDFPSAVETARQQVAALKSEGADIILGLTHAGSGTDTEIAASVGGIAAIIGGHSPWELSPHVRMDSTQTIVTHTGGHNRHLGVIDLLYHAPSRQVVQANARLLRLYASEFPPDPGIRRWADGIREDVGRALDVVIATSDSTYRKTRYRECVIGNLLADAMRFSTGADAAFMNNRGIRAELAEGPVRLRDIFTIMPFDNTVTVMTLTGKELMSLLEESAGLDRDILHMSGVEMEISYAKPPGRRVLKASIGGKKIRRGQKYRIATNSFLAGGGDLFETFLLGRDRQDAGYLLRDAIRDRIADVARASGGLFSGEIEGRIKIIGAVPEAFRDD
ncbi:bifunctional metallophosphatase/5'-nucleotidase [bacterium]|nr:bifunctional metallophosphatase/5'-nucleotidase [bacterium]